MNTDELIRRLSGKVTPVPRHALEKRLLLGAGGGFLLSTILLAFWPGVQRDIFSSPFAEAFLTKLAYTSLLAVGAISASIHLMRPEAKPSAWFLLAAAPAIALCILAIAELMSAPRETWPALIFGRSIAACLTTIFIVSAPVFVGLVWAAKSLAPTRLRAAGASIGFAAGSLASAIYALHCIETAASFIFLWYSAAILIVSAFGALIAPRLLHW